MQKNAWQKNKAQRGLIHVFLPGIFLLDACLALHFWDWPIPKADKHPRLSILRNSLNRMIVAVITARELARGLVYHSLVAVCDEGIAFKKRNVPQTGQSAVRSRVTRRANDSQNDQDDCSVDGVGHRADVQRRSSKPRSEKDRGLRRGRGIAAPQLFRPRAHG
jgi:hypothetical protein